jgi:hypothetical protein
MAFETMVSIMLSNAFLGHNCSNSHSSLRDSTGRPDCQITLSFSSMVIIVVLSVLQSIGILHVWLSLGNVTALQIVDSSICMRKPFQHQHLK